MKIVINAVYDAHWYLSYKAMMLLAKRKGIKAYAVGTAPKESYSERDYEHYEYRNFDEGCDERRFVFYLTKPFELEADIKNFRFEMPERNDPDLVSVIEELGDLANAPFCKLKIVNIPDDVDFEVLYNEEDLGEMVVEKHRIWK